MGSNVIHLPNRDEYLWNNSKEHIREVLSLLCDSPVHIDAAILRTRHHWDRLTGVVDLNIKVVSFPEPLGERNQAVVQQYLERLMAEAHAFVWKRTADAIMQLAKLELSIELLNDKLASTKHR
jgi:hypothetical protein